MSIVIKRSKRKSISIRITQTGQVQVSCPLHMPLYEINNIISQKQNWISKHLNQIEQEKIKNDQFYKLQKVLYLGHEYDLSNDKLSEKILKNWLITQANTVLLESLHRLSKQINIAFDSSKIISARKKWGSCNSKGEIRLNYKMIMLEQKYIDYICIHELCHIKQMNHSKKFWELVEKNCKNYKQLRKELKQFSFCLELF